MIQIVACSKTYLQNVYNWKFPGNRATVFWYVMPAQRAEFMSGADFLLLF